MSDTPKNSEASARSERVAERRKRQLIGAGIGSAAIVAALLYANKGRKGGDKG